MRRRTFLQSVAAGTLTFFFATPVGAAPIVPTRPGTYPEDFNAYLKISADGRVSCLVGKVELGQGAMTVLAMLVAEELELDPAQPTRSVWPAPRTITAFMPKVMAPSTTGLAR